MAVLAREGRNNLWFGTVDRMQWFPTPNRGADVSAVGWEAGGELLNGGAYQLNSISSARNFSFEWPSSSSREAAQLMKSYAEGSYGRGLIYFVDPLTYSTNLFPAHWADPSMTAGFEAPSLVPGVEPTSVVASGGDAMNLPVRSAVYNLAETGPTDPNSLDDSNSVFIPIPEGFALYMGAVYQVSGEGSVYFSKVARGGAVGTPTVIPASPPEGGAFGLMTAAALTQPGEIGVRVWVGRTSSAPGVLTLNGMVARLSPLANLSQPESYVSDPWIGGQGHSGCRFAGKPTYINYSGTNGGQVGFAATFREVGSWAVG